MAAFLLFTRGCKIHLTGLIYDTTQATGACGERTPCVSVRMGVGGTSRAVLSAQVAIKASRQETAPDPPVLVQICLLHVIMSYANLEVMRLRLGQVLSDGPTICPSRPPRLGAFGERLIPAVTFKAGSAHRKDTQGLRNGRVPECGTESLERLRKTPACEMICARVDQPHCRFGVEFHTLCLRCHRTERRP